MRLFDPPQGALTSDDWYTPPHIFDALGLVFGCDPAGPEGGVPWIPAAHTHSIIEDGLTVGWHGLVWLNPPYSAPGPWLARLREHGTGVGLLPNDSASGWWHENIPQADARCFLKGRVQFVQPDNPNRTSARFPHVLVAYGREAARAVRDCGLGWVA